ncbi:alpha/beta fold hydrolase [Actinoplanes italicus]|uniref:Pimeloyl-ACP methyl ester carboxylesterase n=1 Tax=Actinoplanes italicus TaxID=113567 RepID=A0A2T0JZB1_9ACTN|nr:alpha/beta hydrolase [Actinoplanes italicus]PRX15841.1 pimeloyl-ACP methyl ester carboxylesterase [Actinoplanes italicus]
MNTVVLVHGFWHASWCWSPVTELLSGHGVPCVAVDLDGHGLRAGTPAVTATSAASLLIEQLRTIGRGEPVTVVAHSMGGVVATRAAELAPELFAGLIYLSAFAPVLGLPAGAYIDQPENLGEHVTGLIAADPAVTGTLRIDPANTGAVRDCFYHDVPRPFADAAIALLTPDGPLGVTTEAFDVTTERFGRIPVTYLVCTEDRAVPPALQHRFAKEINTKTITPVRVIELPTAHSPFLSHPGVLADAIQARNGS